MNESELDVLGPVDHLVAEFPADRTDFTGEIATETGAARRGVIGASVGRTAGVVATVAAAEHGRDRRDRRR